MSKKDYIAIAAIIKTARDIQDIKINIAAYFAANNPRFDVHKFIAACNGHK